MTKSDKNDQNALSGQGGRQGRTTENEGSLKTSKEKKIEPSPHANSFVIGTAVINTHTYREAPIQVTHDRRQLHDARGETACRGASVDKLRIEIGCAGCVNLSPIAVGQRAAGLHG